MDQLRGLAIRVTPSIIRRMLNIPHGVRILEGRFDMSGQFSVGLVSDEAFDIGGWDAPFVRDCDPLPMLDLDSALDGKPPEAT